MHTANDDESLLITNIVGAVAIICIIVALESYCFINKRYCSSYTMLYFITIRLHFQRTYTAVRSPVSSSLTKNGRLAVVQVCTGLLNRKTKETKFAFTCKKMELKVKKKPFTSIAWLPRVSSCCVCFGNCNAIGVAAGTSYHNALRQFTFLCWQQTLLVGSGTRLPDLFRQYKCPVFILTNICTREASGEKNKNSLI